jgi:hypothetical protein
MRIYQTDTGVALDLDHLLAVGKVKVEQDGSAFFIATLAFASKLSVGAASHEEAESERQKLIEAWQGTAAPAPRFAQRPAQPPLQVESAGPAPSPIPMPSTGPVFPAEDEVQRLIQAHEAARRGSSAAPIVGGALPKTSLDDADYSSPFI